MSYTIGQWVAFNVRISSPYGCEDCKTKGQIISIDGSDFVVRTAHGTSYNVKRQDIIRPLNFAVPKYSVGDKVSAETEYCQKDGDYWKENSVITKVSINGDDLVYAITTMRGGKTYNITENHILKKISIRIPAYCVGKHIGVKTQEQCGMCQYETVVYNGVINRVNPGYDDVMYEIQMYSGKTVSVSESSLCSPVIPAKQKTQKELDEEEENYLKKEEERLNQQLKYISERKKALARV